MSSSQSFLRRYWEVFLVAGLCLFFVLITVPGIAWGAPGFWHPDEVVKLADRALRGLAVFDIRNFDYPSLPKYVLYWLGRAICALGYSRTVFIVAARFLTALLGGLLVGLVYLLARRSGGRPGAGLLAALLLISNSELAKNARFAHNDLYLTTFILLTVLALLQYQRSLHQDRRRAAAWLMLAFLGVGLAASSKYNGISLLLAVGVVGLAGEWPRRRAEPRSRRNVLRIAVIFAAGLALTGLGYVVGTPRAILSPLFYFPMALQGLRNQALFGQDAQAHIGFVGQWGVLLLVWGLPAFCLALAGLTWAFYRAGSLRREADPRRREAAGSSAILLVSILALDLPIMMSYQYQPRYFLPVMALLAVLAGLAVDDWWAAAGGRRWLRYGLLAVCALAIVFGFLRSARIVLLFLNDSRIAAGEYLAGLPRGARIETTFYPPNFPEGRFKTFTYPLFIEKVEGVGPVDKPYDFNQGEAGLEKRHPDYLVVDGFTLSRFAVPAICAKIPDECSFFKRLLAGQTSYKLIRSFDYQPPAWLPDSPSNFLNPSILVFQRAAP